MVHCSTVAAAAAVLPLKCSETKTTTEEKTIEHATRLCTTPLYGCLSVCCVDNGVVF